MNSANFATSKLATSKDMVLAKAVPFPRRKQSRGMLLTRLGGNPIYATSGTMASVIIKHPLANTDTFASSVEDHIEKGHALLRRMLTLDQRHTVGHTSKWSWYSGVRAVCQITINFKPPRFQLLGAAKK